MSYCLETTIICNSIEPKRKQQIIITYVTESDENHTFNCTLKPNQIPILAFMKEHDVNKGNILYTYLYYDYISRHDSLDNMKFPCTVSIYENYQFLFKLTIKTKEQYNLTNLWQNYCVWIHLYAKKDEDKLECKNVKM
ncbi:MAG: hypothetical protein WD512_12460 [Candidatus Paceibacterota bacterium]